jgi:CBS domain-containing protein
MLLMSLDRPVDEISSLAQAIDRHPLIVAPDMTVQSAIGLISQAHTQTCELTPPATGARPPKSDSSCLLVMTGDLLLGILTERDVVRLAALGTDLTDLAIADVMVHPVITLPESALQDVFAALFLFRRYRIRHLPVVDAAGQLLGLISHDSIRQILRPANLLRLRRVSDVMTDQVIHMPLHTPVIKLAQLMAANRVSCIVITQLNEMQNYMPVGIVTERDIVQFQAFQIDLATTQAITVMSTPLYLLKPDDSLWDAHQAMQQRRVGRLVVSWNWGQGLGLVTQTNLLRVFDPMEMYGVIEHLQQTIQALQAQLPPPVVASDDPLESPPDLAIVPVVHGLDRVADDRIAQIQQAITTALIPDLAVEQRTAQLQSTLVMLADLARSSTL